MRPPIFVIDREGWVEMFDSAEQLSAHIEPWFVADAELEAALDSEGRLMRLGVYRVRARDGSPAERNDQDVIEVVTVEPAEADPSHARYLRDALRRALRSSRRNVERLELADLVAVAALERKGVGVGESIF